MFVERPTGRLSGCSRKSSEKGRKGSGKRRRQANWVDRGARNRMPEEEGRNELMSSTKILHPHRGGGSQVTVSRERETHGPKLKGAAGLART